VACDESGGESARCQSMTLHSRGLAKQAGTLWREERCRARPAIARA